MITGRKIIVTAIISVLLVGSGYSQNVAINSTNTPANAAAGLDVNYTNKGLLISRVALTSTTSAAPLSAHVAGMMVYNTATTADVLPGLYYNNGTRWVSTLPPSGVATGDLQYWNGTAWVTLPVGQTGQKLQLTSAGLPAWGNGILPTLTTLATSGLTANSVNTGGIITSDGGSAVTARGVCWSLNHNPTVLNSKTTDGLGSGSFNSSIAGLSSATTYYTRSYATNSNGTDYGNELTIVTP